MVEASEESWVKLMSQSLYSSNVTSPTGSAAGSANAVVGSAGLVAAAAFFVIVIGWEAHSSGFFWYSLISVSLGPAAKLIRRPVDLRGLMT